MQVFTVGSLTLDLFLEPAEQTVLTRHGKEFLAFELDSKIRARGVHELFGGGAANVAVGLRRLGFQKVACVGAVGEDALAPLVLANLRREKVSSRFVSKIRGERTGFSVIVNSASGKHTALFHPAANHAFDRLDQNIFHNCDALHLARLAGRADRVFETVRKFFKKHPAKYLSWNPGSEQIKKGLAHFRDFLPVVDILFLNLAEAESFARARAGRQNIKFKKARDGTPGFRKIFTHGFRGIVVLTDGSRGTQACDGARIFHAPVFSKFKMVDTLGAGDAFASTFLAAQLLQKDIPASLRLASVNSASVVSRFGAQPGMLSFVKIKKFAEGLKVAEKKL